MVIDNRFCRPQSAVRPRYHINDGGISGHSAQPFAQNHNPQVRASPKVVQIPVRFVDSEPSRLDSAIKIQKVFRGFLIRSRVKKILQLKKETNEIELRMSRRVELIQRDQRERMRINEMLMALLLKLDSIRSFDAGVRDCRKSVIKKVISLQERLDAISYKIQSEFQGEFEKNVSPAQSIVEVLSNSVDESDQKLLDNEILQTENKLAAKDSDPEICVTEEKCLNIDAAGICEEDGGTDQSETKSNEENYDTSRDEFEDANAIESRMKAKSETEEIVNMIMSVVNECKEETMDNNTIVESGGLKKENGVNNQQVMLQRLMEDNQRMMNMMTQLFDKNEKQTQMLNTLRNKVEQLEKAFVCDIMRKKKKRHYS